MKSIRICFCWHHSLCAPFYLILFWNKRNDFLKNLGFDYFALCCRFPNWFSHHFIKWSLCFKVEIKLKIFVFRTKNVKIVWLFVSLNFRLQITLKHPSPWMNYLISKLTITIQTMWKLFFRSPEPDGASSFLIKFSW